MKITILSHRRSGTHLLMSYINKYLGVQTIKEHMFFSINKNDNVLYIARDGRDTLASCFRWWRDSGESKVCGIMDDFKNTMINEKGEELDLRTAFYRYLKGINTPYYQPFNSSRDFSNNTLGEAPNVFETEMELGLLYNPIKFWNDHVCYALKYLQLPLVKYEDLIQRPEKIIHFISKYFTIPIKNIPFEKITKPVGYHPGKGGAGGYKDYFNEESTELFNKNAKEAMELLGY